MASKNREEIRDIFRQHFTDRAYEKFMSSFRDPDKTESMERDEMIEEKVGWFRVYTKRFLTAWNVGDVKGIAKYAAKMTSFVELALDLEGIMKMVGGTDNIFIHSKIQGFREGAEDGDTTLISNTIGQIGDRYYAGPLMTIKNKTGMTNGEFFADWLIK